MTRTFDRTAERDAPLWPLLAASILAIEGARTLLFTTLIAAQPSGGQLDLPVLGTSPYVWIATGVVALIAAVGIVAHQTWGRYLGSFSALLTILALVLGPQHTLTGVLAIVLPWIVLFALWRKWPTSRTA